MKFEEYIIENLEHTCHVNFNKIKSELENDNYITVGKFGISKIDVGKESNGSFIIFSNRSQIGFAKTEVELENFIEFFNECVSIANELSLNDNKISLYSRQGNHEITCNFAIKGSIKNATQLEFNLKNKKYLLEHLESFNINDIKKAIYYIKLYKTNKLDITNEIETTTDIKKFIELSKEYEKSGKSEETKFLAGIIKISNGINGNRDIDYVWTTASNRKLLIAKMKNIHDSISSNRFHEYVKATNTPGTIYTSYVKFKKDYINTIGGEVPSEENIKHAAEH